MPEGRDRTQQIREEQHAIDEMYARLDAEVSERLAARTRTLAAAVDGPQDLLARDQEVARLSGDVRRLRSAERSLCFGRIDTPAPGKPLHIGRIGLRADTGDLLLVDWRADAARPFYSATSASPSGVRRRRHVRVDDRRVVDISDELLDGSGPSADDVVGDEALVSALSTARTGRMREAAATLQNEQDEIVRSSDRGIVVVDGGPGTGKTVVALHRAAYVLYAFPAIAARGILVVGPSRRFLTYIADVLPSLGENGVQSATLDELAGAATAGAEPDRIARIKGRSELAAGLAEWVRDREPRSVPLELPTGHGTVTLAAEVIDGARRSARSEGIGHNRARGLFTEFVVAELVNALERQTEQEISDFEAEITELFGIDLDRRVPGEPREGEPEAGLEIDWERVREDLLDDANIARIVAGVWPRLRAEDAVRGLLADLTALRRLLPDVSADDLAHLADADGIGCTSADLALLDEAREIIDGPPDAVYGHIVVDEAQWLSEMQWRMVMRRCPGRSMTIVGDLAQAGPTTTVGSWVQALGPFVDERFSRRTLTINYRIPAEILQTTASLLDRIAPGQRLSRSIRHGESPVDVKITDDGVVAALTDLIARAREQHPGELIGVVVPARSFSVLEAAVGAHDTTVVSAPDARGLEFDTVVIVDSDGIRTGNEAGLRDLYVARTRATKRLITVTVTRPNGNGESICESF